MLLEAQDRSSSEAALEVVDRLGLDDYRYLHWTRVELLRRLGHSDDARAALRVRVVAG